MKKAFPGDVEFTWDRFYQLPYEYVLLGFYKVIDLHRAEMHDMEMPIALNTAVYANSQRDPKSQKKPYSPMDFALYKPVEGDGPAGYYSACYMHALKKGEMPPWALFCYKEVASSARGDAGSMYALFAEDAVLFGPRHTGEGFTGFLVALESCSGQLRDFRDPSGKIHHLQLPVIETKVIAKEDVTLS